MSQHLKRYRLAPWSKISLDFVENKVWMWHSQFYFSGLKLVQTPRSIFLVSRYINSLKTCIALRFHKILKVQSFENISRYPRCIKYSNATSTTFSLLWRADVKFRYQLGLYNYIRENSIHTRFITYHYKVCRRSEPTAISMHI